MRVLVTGAAGFVGSVLCERLLAEGHEVVGVDAFIPYYPRSLKELNLVNLMNEPSFVFHELDLRTDPLKDLVAGVDAVYNLAAMAGLVRSWKDLGLYTSCNILAVQRLLEACLHGDVKKFIHISTSSVYGSEAVGDENLPTKPVSPYGITKLAADHLVLAYHERYGFPASILRYFSVYGPRQRPDMAYRIFIDAMLEGQPITIFGDGRQSRSITFVTDCVEGTIQAFEGAVVGEIYNIGGGDAITLIESVKILRDLTGHEPVIRFEPARAGDQLHTFADTTKARRAFGYAPLVPPRDGLRRQVEWQMGLPRAAAPRPS